MVATGVDDRLREVRERWDAGESTDPGAGRRQPAYPALRDPGGWVPGAASAAVSAPSPAPTGSPQLHGDGPQPRRRSGRPGQEHDPGGPLRAVAHRGARSWSAVRGVGVTRSPDTADSTRST